MCAKQRNKHGSFQVHRSNLYQESLKKGFLATKEGKTVCVRLMPDPDNPYDSHAVAFECQVDGCWRVC